MAKYNIIIPTDLSENAQNASDFGIALFDSEESQITLLNTFNIPYIPLGTNVPKNDVVYLKAKAKFDVEIDRIHSRFPKLKAQLLTRFEIGDIVSVVRHIEECENISVVVMGTKGASGLSEVLVGSRTSAMIKKVDSPILAVPENSKFGSINTIMFATDLHMDPDDNSEDILQFILNRYKPKMNIVHISGKTKTLSKAEIAHKKELVEHFPDNDRSYSYERSNDIVKGIEKHILSKPTDLIAMISKRGKLFHKIFHKSITKRIALHTEIPLLIMHSEE